MDVLISYTTTIFLWPEAGRGVKGLSVTDEAREETWSSGRSPRILAPETLTVVAEVPTSL